MEPDVRWAVVFRREGKKAEDADVVGSFDSLEEAIEWLTWNHASLNGGDDDYDEGFGVFPIRSVQ